MRLNVLADRSDRLGRESYEERSPVLNKHRSDSVCPDVLKGTSKPESKTRIPGLLTLLLMALSSGNRCNLPAFQALGEAGRGGVKFGDPTGNRTRATTVKGWCPNR